MHHEHFTSYESVKGSSEQSFGFLFGVIFVGIGLQPVLHQGELRLSSLSTGLALLLVAKFRPRLLQAPNRYWLMLALMLSRIMNPLITGLLFLCVVMPTSLLLRLMRKDVLRLRFDSRAETYWIQREVPGPPPKSMTNQF
ncbi:MAG: SxtJ family membrane protein [Acidobacteria bacterium]|nr:SxtJ family membrane protein [Acidobacteriota bacterium]MCI0723636.1 SxtJ family membrane protein [Acidobacteriota bacterium]